MLWPLLVEYSEPGPPLLSNVQQQGNMALFLTLFILTCVEVLIVKVAQSERELAAMFTPHDPPYSGEDEDEDDDW